MQTDAKRGDIVVLNPGSSTIKWARYAAFTETDAIDEGQAEIAELEANLLSLADRNNVLAYVIRFVHGGDLFSKPIVITDRNYKYLQSLADWAPLHNNNSLLCVRFLLQRDDNCKIIAVFDTHFFHDLPLVARSYGLPHDLVKKYKIRRYGFHGFSHQFMRDAWEEQSKKPKQYSIVTMQLGSGCSMALIKNGKPVDTTMGFTPNEGLLMSTRSGDIDACLVTWLQKQESWTPEQTECELNKNSGWFGVSSLSKNFGQLLNSEDEKANLAVELFCYRIRKTLGAYYAISGGLDGILLSGGIAENEADLHMRIFANVEHLGIKLDSVLNNAHKNTGLISAKESKVACYVVKNNESYVMLQEARAARLL